jgi:hypothetical protein
MRLIELDSEDWLLFTDEVRRAVDASLINTELGACVDSSKLFLMLNNRCELMIKKKIEPFNSTSCNFAYSHSNLEYILWMNALLSMAWSCEIFRRKIRDGHCQNSSHSKPCTMGSEQHKLLRNEVIRSFGELLLQLKAVPITLSDKGKSSFHPIH